MEEIDDRRTGRVTTFEDKFGNVSVYEYLYDYEEWGMLYDIIQKGRDDYLSLTEKEQEHLWGAVQYAQERLFDLGSFGFLSHYHQNKLIIMLS